ncbi:hypothetical protein [Sorangium sp. So ce1335]
MPVAVLVLASPVPLVDPEVPPPPVPLPLEEALPVVLLASVVG